VAALQPKRKVLYFTALQKSKIKANFKKKNFQLFYATSTGITPFSQRFKIN
jgi:hypothetical protein